MKQLPGRLWDDGKWYALKEETNVNYLYAKDHWSFENSYSFNTCSDVPQTWFSLPDRSYGFSWRIKSFWTPWFTLIWVWFVWGLGVIYRSVFLTITKTLKQHNSDIKIRDIKNQGVCLANGEQEETNKIASLEITNAQYPTVIEASTLSLPNIDLILDLGTKTLNH